VNSSTPRPEVIALPKPLASVIALYRHGGARIPSLTFANVESLRGIETRSGHPPRGNVAIKETGHATLSLDGHYSDRPDGSETLLDVGLSDGSVVASQHAYVASQGASIVIGQSTTLATEVELTEWQWSTGKEPVAWVGVLHGAQVRHARNLLVYGHGKRCFDSLRLEGNAAWHLTQKGAFGPRSCVAVIDTKGTPVERAELWHDFAALEFLFGAPLRLDTLIGVDSENHPVAAYGASFGYRYRSDANREPPLPDERDVAWMAVAFPLVARALSEAAPSPTTMAACSYVDSMVGHLDGQYLFAQIGLEALANRLTPSKVPLVRSDAEWKTWLKTTRETWAAHARDQRAEGDMYSKLKAVARPTTSSLTRDLFGAWGIQVPDEALREIRGRNTVAHTGLMNEEGEDYDIERDVRRIRIVRALLAAMVLRQVGYEGALNGWDLDDQGWRRRADWFTASDAATVTARQLYEANAGPPEQVPQG
jgi:hypothetical protein